MPNIFLDPDTDDQNNTRLDPSQGDIDHGLEELESYVNNPASQNQEDNTSNLHKPSADTSTRTPANTERSENYVNTGDTKRPSVNDLERSVDETESSTSLYTGLGDQDKDTVRQHWRAKGKRRKIITGSVLGGGAIGLIGGLILFMGALAPFKLEHFLSNIESKSFAPYNVIFERRSNAWTRAYIKARLLHPQGAGESLYFRADGVDNDTRFKNWYHSLHSTKRFEQDLLDNHGIAFTSERNGDGSISFAKIIINGNEREFVNTSNSSVSDLLNSGELDNFIVESFDNDRDARRVINRAISENTRWNQVLKRRNIRRNVRNMTGVRQWRFFEQTRGNLDDKKRVVQQRFLDFVLAPLGDGNTLKCILGSGSCPTTVDANDSNNHVRNSYDGDRVRTDDEPVLDENGDPVLDDNGDPVTRSDSDSASKVANEIGDPDSIAGTGNSRASSKAEFIDKLLKKFIPGLNVVDLLDTFSHVDKLVKQNKLSKMVSLNRMTQYMAFYTSFRVATDQLKAGEDIDTDQVGIMMETMDGAENSAGFTDALGSGRDFGYVTNRAYASVDCPESGQPEGVTVEEYACFGDDKKVNSSTNNASKIEDGYNNTLGKVVGPLISVYDGVRGLPVISNIVDGIQAALGAVTDAALQGILSVLGLEEEAENLTQTIGQKLMEFMGGAPLCAGDEPAGESFNCLYAGATATAQTSIRNAGGAKTESLVAQGLTPSNLSALDKGIEPLHKRLFSTSLSDSLVTQLALTTPTNTADLLAALNPLNLFNGRSFFSRSAIAQTSESAASFAGMQEYNLPEEFIASDPSQITKPEQCTNAYDVLGNDIVLDMALVEGGQDFWDYIYTQIEEKGLDPDIAQDIYNGCETDMWVSNSMQSVYSKEDDGGLGNGGTAPTSNQTAPETGNVKQLAQKVLDHPKIRFDFGESGRIAESFRQVARTGKAPLYTIQDNQTVAVDPVLLQLIIDLADHVSSYVQISSLSTSRSHSDTSLHYSGNAVDIGNEAIADEVMPFLFQRRDYYSINELFLNTPAYYQYNIDDGQPINSGRDASNHIHVGVD